MRPFRAYPLACAAVCSILLLRRPDLLRCPVLTWEDGGVFLSDAINGDLLHTLLAPYQGYFHVLPRLLAAPFDPFTAWLAPRALILAAVVVVSAIIALPVSGWFSDIPTRARWAVVLATAFLPWCPETLGTFANMHWYVIYGLALFSLGDLRRAEGVWLPVVVALLLVGVFTSPNSVLLVPVLATRLLAERKTLGARGKTLIGIALALILLKVTLVKLLHTVDSAVVPPAPVRAAEVVTFVAKGLGFKVVAMTMLGQRITVAHLGNRPAYLAGCAVLLALVGVVCWLAAASRQPTRRVVLLGSAYFTAAPVLIIGLLRPMYIEHFVARDQYAGADRYFVTPSFFLLVILVAIAEHLLARRDRWRWAALLMLAGYSGAVLGNLRFIVNRYFGWDEYLEVYYRELLGVRSAAGAPASFELPTLPGPPWTVHLPLWQLSPAQRTRAQAALRHVATDQTSPPPAWDQQQRLPARQAVIDTLDTAVGDGRYAVLGGWAVDDLRREPAAEVHVLVDDRIQIQAHAGRLRSDVATALGNPRVVACGWYCVLDLSRIAPGEHRVVARFRSRGSHVVFETAPVRLVAPPPT